MAFELAEAYVQFSQRGLKEVQGIATRLDGDFLEAARQAQGLDRKLDGIDSVELKEVSRESRKAAGGLRGASGMARRFAGALAAAGLAAGAGAVLKFGADAEQTEVKLRVLLGSADKAKTLLGEINTFAAKTPFEQLEVSQATQQLIAFGMSEDEVLDRLREIGDIASLTGTPLGELAELYGKAQVAGTLYGEDLNQLMGRGIPIMEALAKATGKPASEIKKLASEGKISSDHLTEAFKNMTSAGGDYEGGMEQLSETTAGKFSTLTGNLKQQTADLGHAFLPAASLAIEGANHLVEGVGERIGPFLTMLEEDLGFVARNSGDLWALGMAHIALAVDNGIERVRTFGTNTVEIMDWVGNNWHTILEDMAGVTAKMLTNIGKNLGDFFVEIQSWMRGDGFNFKFTALTEGFKPATEAPKLTEAAVRETSEEIDRLNNSIAEREAERTAKQAGNAEDAAKKVAAAGEESSERMGKAATDLRNANIETASSLFSRFSKGLTGGGFAEAAEKAAKKNKKEPLPVIGGEKAPGGMPKNEGAKADGLLQAIVNTEREILGAINSQTEVLSNLSLSTVLA